MSALASEVAPGVHRLCDAGVNCYAIEDAGGIVLVDCGWPRGGAALVDGLRAVGHGPQDVRAVVLTHGHPDHVGSSRWLQETHGATVHAHTAEHERVLGHRPSTRSAALVRDLWRPTALRFVVTALRRGVNAVAWPDEVGAGELPAGLVAVPTPGHTEGHCAYLLPRGGALFSGDALVTRSVLTGRTGPQLHPRAFQVDVARAAESLGALAAVEATVLLPGHGEPWAGAMADAAATARAGR